MSILRDENRDLKELNYFTYVLSYDLLHDYFKRSNFKECDTSFEDARRIALNFMNSEEYQDLSLSGYEALEVYLKNRGFIGG